MLPSLIKAIADFRISRQAVYELLEFDAVIIDLAVSRLRSFEEQNRKAWEGSVRARGHLAPDARYKHQDRLSLDGTIKMLETIRTSGSLKPKYEMMVNQCVVLLVAHFASAIRNVLHGGLEEAIQRGTSEAAQRYEVRIRAADLRNLDRPLHSFIAEQIILGADLSFQDMQSIARAFKTYFKVVVARDAIINDIIAAQAARHVVAHSGDLVDDKMVKQLRDARPRRVLENVQVGDRLRLTPEEVRHAGEAMGAYLERIVSVINGSFAEPAVEAE